VLKGVCVWKSVVSFSYVTVFPTTNHTVAHTHTHRYTCALTHTHTHSRERERERGEMKLHTRAELEATPSRKDGIEAGREARYRREGAIFIRRLGHELDL
jgi:hypothetical protein